MLHRMVGIQILICLGFCASVSATFYQTVAEVGKVSNHSHPFSVSSAKTPGTCAMECERHGESDCRAFNVIQATRGYSCELFHARSHKMSDLQMVESANGRYFEMTCNGLSLRTGVKDVVDEEEIVTMIGVDQNVYQQRSGRMLTRLGRVSEVFDGFDQEAMDMSSTTVDEKGRIHLIRSGELLYCFVAENGWKKFKNCAISLFPMNVAVLLSNRNKETEGAEGVTRFKYLIAYDVQKLVKLRDDNTIKVTINSLEGLQSGNVNEKLRSSEEDTIYCNRINRDSYGLCPWAVHWAKASGGVFLSSTRVCFFVKTTCYIFDINLKTMVEHYPICKDEINNFLL